MSSLLWKISLIGALVFAVLWLVTSTDRVYETIEFDIVPLRRVFGVLALVCVGFFLASLFLWN
jgi:hypothetical protein